VSERAIVAPIVALRMKRCVHESEAGVQQISIVAERLGVKIGLETHDAFSAAATVARNAGARA